MINTKHTVENTEYIFFDGKNEKRELQAVELLQNQKRIAFDSETTGLNPASRKERLRLIQLGTRDKTFLFDFWRISENTKQALKCLFESTDVTKIIHNAVFDIEFIRADLKVLKFGTVYCTQLAERLCSFMDFSVKISLAATVERRFGKTLDKEQRLSDWSKPHLDEQQLQYAANDLQFLFKICDAQIEELKTNDMIRTAKLDFECAEPLAALQLNGIYLNYDKWLEKTEKAKKRAEELKLEISRILAPERQMLFDMPSFDVSKRVQVAKRLADMHYTGKITLPIDEYNKPLTKLEDLKAMYEKPLIVELLVEYGRVRYDIDSMGENWEEFICGTTGRIHPYVNMLAAKTSRFSISSPPMQQIKKENETRNCFQAQSADRVIVKGDYSQIELRIIAEFSKDAKMIKAFIDGVDFHTQTAAYIYDLELDEVADAERNPSKNMNFLTVYGGGAGLFASNMRITLEKAQGIMKRYFSTFSGMKAWLDTSGFLAVKERKSRTLAGHTLKHNFNPYDSKASSKVKRLGSNMPVQGTSSDILKRALRLLHDAIGDRDDIWLVNVVHDEIVLECLTSIQDYATMILEKVMLEASSEFLKLVPVKVDISVNRVWSK